MHDDYVDLDLEDSQFRENKMYCPNCGHRTEEFRCKVLCPKCGLMLEDCGDGGGHHDWEIAEEPELDVTEQEHDSED